ncbi:hypothetical protein H4R18_004943 [Coemansia javaensis]|uniref:Major facilitator superfamily (MFS) profile domain-containing protein n=1 Tax=Coemansia javaensis TaxID=2761396 RepID=A0A9W8LFK5_9FUNG|nr:hypothetical protein H4R18_004943 [Coemansia javaensis]
MVNHIKDDSRATLPEAPPGSGLEKRIEQATLEKHVEEDGLEKHVEQGEQAASDAQVQAGAATVQMSTLRRMVIFLSLALTMLLASLDFTIVTTAIPKISLEFHALSNATWIATAYMLTTTALQPLYGRVSDTFGRVPTLVGAIVVFMSGSAACGWAHSLGVIIFGRALQGIGGAGLIGLVFIVISDITSEEERPAYMGVLGAVWSIASVVGPVLGGVFSDKVSWRWAFLINLPVAGTVLVVVLLFMRLPIPRGSLWDKLKRIDLLGSLVLIGAVVMLLLALTWGGKTFPWGSARIVCLLVFGVALLAIFALIEWKVALGPTVPMHLFRVRNVWLSVVGQFFIGAGMFVPMFYVPIWYTIVKNSSAISAGLHLLPYLLSVSLVSIASGFIVSKTGRYRALVICGTAVFIVGLGLLVLFEESVSQGKQIGFLLIAGFGLGFNIQILLIVVQAAAAVEDMAAATTLFLFARMLGSSIGVAIMQSVLQNAIIPKLDLLSAQYPDHKQVFTDALNDQSAIYKGGLPDDIRAQLIHYYVKALQKVFIANVAFASASFFFTLPLKHVPLRAGIKAGVAE